MREASGRRAGLRFAAFAALLVLAVAAVYAQTARHEFISYDDDVYITANPMVSHGFTVKGVRQAFGFHAANWHPLTWLSHMLDSELFGSWAGGHHLVSAAIHAANAVALFAVLGALTGRALPSAATAALFALHPLRVESVAWASERKDVLSTLLLLLTIGAYVRYARRPGAGRYAGVLLLFAAGLMAKPMLVTLPFALLLLDFWPLGRFRGPGAAMGGAAGGAPAWRRSRLAPVAEKVPLFALSVVSSIVTLIGQTTDVIPSVHPDAATRLANAAVSYLLYLRDFAWPSQLALPYPYPRGGVPVAPALGAAATLALVTATAVFLRQRRPYLATGWLWYLGTLVPVIGLVQVGAQSRSDRYTSVSQIGIAIALVWLAADGWPRRRWARRALAAGSLAAIASLALVAAAYVRVWSGNIPLYEHVLRVTRDNVMILDNYGNALQDVGRYAEAARAHTEAVRVDPEHCNSKYNLGNALYRLRRYREALDAYERSLACYLREGRQGAYLVDTYANLGNTNLTLNRPAEAERHYRALLHIDPNNSWGHAALRDAIARQRGAGQRRATPPR